VNKTNAQKQLSAICAECRCCYGQCD